MSWDAHATPPTSACSRSPTTASRAPSPGPRLRHHDRGSDIERLRGAGIALRVDITEHDMHHEFAVLDGGRLLNGSYNWTRSAATYNEENLIVTSDPALVRTFAKQFAAMWEVLGH